MDLWMLCRPKAKAREQLIVGRLFIVVLVVISILWMPIIERSQGGQLFVYIQVIASYLAPPIAAIYCMAVIWKRLNEPGAFWGLMIGFVVGMVRMSLDFYYTEPPCGEEDLRPNIIKKIHYMYFATLMFWGTCLVSVIVTFITEPPEEWRLIRTTYFTRLDHRDREDDMEMKERVNNELLEVAHTVDEASVDGDHHVPWYKKAYYCICGFDVSKDAEEQAVAMNEHLAELTNLHQETWEKYLLNSMLVVILVAAVALFVYFSISPFTEEEVRDIQRRKLEELGYYDVL